MTRKRPRSELSGVLVTVRIPQRYRALLDTRAEDKDWSLSYTVIDLIERAWKVPADNRVIPPLPKEKP